MDRIGEYYIIKLGFWCGHSHTLLLWPNTVNYRQYVSQERRVPLFLLLLAHPQPTFVIRKQQIKKIPIKVAASFSTKMKRVWSDVFNWRNFINFIACLSLSVIVRLLCSKAYKFDYQSPEFDFTFSTPQCCDYLICFWLNTFYKYCKFPAVES